MQQPSVRYLQLSNLPRRSDKARIHYVPKGATDVFKGNDFVHAAQDFAPGTNIEEMKEKLLDEIINEFADSEAGMEAIMYLRSIGRDFQEGDIIAIGDFVDREGPEHIGLYGYINKSSEAHPERLLRFESDEDNAYMFLPREYQIITKFPLHYWSDLPENIVPFDLSKVTFDFKKDLYKLDPEKYAGFQQALPFQHGEKVYYILIQNMYDFELYYLDLKYFEVRESSDEIWSELPYPLNFENTLFIPDVNTPLYNL